MAQYMVLAFKRRTESISDWGWSLEQRKTERTSKKEAKEGIREGGNLVEDVHSRPSSARRASHQQEVERASDQGSV